MENIDEDQLLKESPSGHRDAGEYLYGFEETKDQSPLDDHLDTLNQATFFNENDEI